METTIPNANESFDHTDVYMAEIRHKVEELVSLAGKAGVSILVSSVFCYDEDKAGSELNFNSANHNCSPVLRQKLATLLLKPDYLTFFQGLNALYPNAGEILQVIRDMDDNTKIEEE